MGNLSVIFLIKTQGPKEKYNRHLLSTSFWTRLRFIYKSDFKLQFRIKQAHFREYNFIVCLVNLQDLHVNKHLRLINMQVQFRIKHAGLQNKQ